MVEIDKETIEKIIEELQDYISLSENGFRGISRYDDSENTTEKLMEKLKRLIK